MLNSKGPAITGTPGPHDYQEEPHMNHFLASLMTDESGQDLIEYALVAALVALGSVAAIKVLGNSIGTAFNGVGTQLTNA